MIDELPGFASETSAHEAAVDAAVADGWEIKGYSITTQGEDTYKEALLYKAGAPPELAATEDECIAFYGKNYWPLRKALKEKAAKRNGPMIPDAARRTKKPKATRAKRK